MAHAYDFAKKKYNIEIDPFEIDRKVAMGPKKPSSGKSNAYRLLDKTGKKAIQVQVANLDNQRYELNMYKEDLDEQKNDPPFDPDPPKKKSDVVPGKHGSGPSMAKHLAKMALKKQMDKKKDVKEDAEQVAEKVVKGKGYDNPENERKGPEGKVPMTSLMPGHSDKAARFAAVQAKGKLVKGKAQSAPQKEEFDPSILDEAFSPAMVAKLKAEYSKIDRIDPSSPNYKKLTAMLDKMDMKDLESLADAGIKFVSGLAKNRVSRNAMKRGEGSKGKNYLMSKNEEVEIEESGDMGPVNKGKEKTVMMRHKTSGKEIVVVPSGVKEKQKLGYEVVKEEVEIEESGDMGPVNKGKEKTVMMRHKTSGKEIVVVPSGVKEKQKLGYEVVKEEVEQIDEVKVGDTVHVGMAKKGGAGFKGTVHKIDGEKVHVKVGTTKYGDRIVAGQMKNVTKEEVEVDTSKKAKPAFKDAKKAGDDMNDDCVAEGKYQKLTTQQKFKNSMKRAGYDMDAGAKRLQDLLDKQKKEREEREKREMNEAAVGSGTSIKDTQDQAKRAKNESVNEAEGGGTAIPSEKQAIDQKRRAQIDMKSADLKIKQEREREKLRKERAALRNKMFSEAMKKDKKKEATSKDKLKKGEALSGKAEPIEVSPEMNPTK